jgi:hypothetical protein
MPMDPGSAVRRGEMPMAQMPMDPGSAVRRGSNARWAQMNQWDYTELSRPMARQGLRLPSLDGDDLRPIKWCNHNGHAANDRRRHH